MLRTRERSDRGSATVELAMLLPAVVAMMGVVMGGLAWAQTSLRVQDAASTGARVAIVDGDGAAVAAAQRVVGESATVGVIRADGWVTVTVEVPPRGLVPAAGARATAKAQP